MQSVGCCALINAAWASLYENAEFSRLAANVLRIANDQTECVENNPMK